MLKLWRDAPSHEDLFIERYERLLGWSLKLTANDRQLAEDLLHDVFVHFTLRRPDLNTIQDLESYLFAMLRNSHVSYVRRAPYVRTAPLSMAEYDSLEIGLRAADMRDQIKIQDELRLICHYGALRKETSKAGSVLLLRFFHGYYPSEIAQVLKSRIDTVRKWLQLARNEAKIYLETPEALSFLREKTVHKPQVGFARNTEELLDDLREVIFSAKSGDCLSVKQLREIYSAKSTLVGPVLAHIVSCRLCLDQVNTLLGLPLLKDRYPTDMTGNDMGGPGGPTAIVGGAGKGGIRRSLRRVKETFEHYPKELRIAVNGYVQVSQTISSDLMEQTLSLDLEERVGFVEIFSEQWIRLFFLNIEPPPEGAFEQQGRMAFSEGRSLKASLDFSGPCPKLQIIYHDPTLAAEPGVESLESEVQADIVQSPKSREQSAVKNAFGLWARVSAPLWDLRFFSRPGGVTALFAMLLIGIALFVQVRRTPAPTSARELLAQAATAEEAIALRKDQVLHRTIALEEKRATGEVIARRKIEVWHSAEKGITARRLYDERGQLIAGDWRRADGVQTLYHHGVQPKLQLPPNKALSPALNFENVWLLSPSATEFSSLILDAAAAQLQETGASYLILYESDSRTNGNGLVRATLVLSRADLHPTEQTVVVQQGNEVREFRFIEASFERRPPTAVAPSVFEPEMELLFERMNDERGRVNTDTPHPSPLIPQPSVMATAELEVEVLGLLNQAGADMGEQVNVTRTSEGLLRIEGVVDTSERKRQILAELSPILSSPAVKVDIQTTTEAVERASRKRANASSVTIERVEISKDKMPAGPDLQRYLGKDQDTEEVRRFASRMISLSSQAVSHAGAMRKLVNQFPPDELRTLNPEARAKWLALLRSHAAAFKRDTAILRRDLQPIFFPSSTSGDVQSDLVITSDGELVLAVQRLFESAAANYEAVRSAFSTSSNGSSTSAMKTTQFVRSLKSTEALAAKIGAVAHQ
ncbi:MAG TPA: sigma-70 family RNA polymerase sigma factor [Pyrinomonadaceae bacterium]|nr:sigma-70 family RNA polymerase sigma factor [Pyrinomonadaceae bacterium]